LPERTHWLGTAVAATLIGAACGGDALGPDGEGVLGEWVRSFGVERTYELRLPASYTEGQPAPLLIAFHGSPDSGAGFEARSGLTSAADQAGFITIYPDGIDGTWDVNDVLLVVNLITHLSDNLSIDRDRIYVTGFSAGGTITQMIACARPDVLAAVAIAGATLRRDISESCRPPEPIPILFVHGTEDAAFPWEGITLGNVRRLSVVQTLARWTALNRCVGDAAVDTLPDLVDDGTRAWIERWDQCAGGSEVMLYGIEGGGHTWPGGPGPFPPGRISREISSEEIVEFLARFDRGG
jgi:polyhydroxybutyrate depolymerase